MSGEILSTVEVNPRASIRSSIIWLHGLGADGHDFEPIVPQLDLPPDLGVRFVFPHAPHLPVTINGGYVMRAWYDIYGTDLSSRVDRDGILRSVQAVRALLEREIGLGVAPERIILAGFSQGGVIALDLAANCGLGLGGVIALSTYVALDDRLACGSPLSIFWGHGAADTLIPLQLGERGRAVLESLGHKVDWHVYPMDHAVCNEEVRDIRGWLLATLMEGQDSAG
jgi:phospholipase/carboxylesterase